MADFYSQFSQVVDLNTPEELTWWQDLKDRHESLRWPASDDDIPNEDYDFDFDIEEGRVWVYCTREGSESSAAAEQIHRFLKQFGRDDIIEIPVACWCSKPRVGEQTAHAQIISKEGWQTVHLRTLINNAVHDIRHHRHDADPAGDIPC
jgi:hypothetical protein